MAPTGYFIDSNLLVLLVAGRVGRTLIRKHKRLTEYTEADYDVLLGLVRPAKKVFVTPNTLTETSNLLTHHGEPERSRLMEALRNLILSSLEVVVASADASANAAFDRLGLTDAALLGVVSTETPLLTSDVNLYLAASSLVPGSAVNFSQLRTF